MDNAVTTPQQADLEFAETLDACAAESEQAGDHEFASYFRKAAKWHRNAARPGRPADVLTGAEQLALPEDCRCAYARSVRDGLWRIISRGRCVLHGAGAS